MLPNNNQTKSNTLMSWATSKPVMIGLGLGIGIFLYQAWMLQKLTSKIFKKEKDQAANKQTSPNQQNTTNNNATSSTSQ